MYQGFSRNYQWMMFVISFQSGLITSISVWRSQKFPCDVLSLCADLSVLVLEQGEGGAALVFCLMKVLATCCTLLIFKVVAVKLGYKTL